MGFEISNEHKECATTTSEQRLRLLLVAYFYPPIAAIGSLRSQSFARWLPRYGIDVTVVTPKWHGHLPIDNTVLRYGKVVETGILPAVTLPRSFESAKLQASSTHLSSISSSVLRSQLRALSFTISACLRDVSRFPDEAIGWYPYAIRDSLRELKTGRYDYILSSAPPFTAHAIGATLKDRTGLPWIADYRDTVSGNPYIKPRKLRQLDRWARYIERRLVKYADLMVTTSEQYRNQMIGVHNRTDIALVFNGYEPDDLSCPELNVDGSCLSITYTGELDHTRDPSPLFQALQIGLTNGWLQPDLLRVRFFGNSSHMAKSIADSYGIPTFVEVRPRVSRNESLKKQLQSSILLFIDTMPAEQQLAISGKLFEYLATGKPILGISPYGGAMAQFLANYERALVSVDPIEIENFLHRHWEAAQIGFQPKSSIPASDTYNYTREAQASLLAKLMWSSLDVQCR